ncbi:metallophosphoesterase family protein, partial [Staphylococcus epidermidis]
MLKFIHSPHFHFHTPFKSKTYLTPNIFQHLQNTPYQTFKNILHLPLKHELHFIIIPPHLFHTHNPTFPPQVFLNQQFQTLTKQQIFLYISHPNHHPLTSKITTHSPNNLSLFSNQLHTYQPITKSPQTIYIHPFTYQNHPTYQNKIHPYPSTQPHNRIHIPLLHPTYSKSSLKHRYTQFRLEHLNQRLYHYW